MPVAWRLHVLEERLKRECGIAPVVESAGLYDLTPADQNATLNSLIETGGGFPVVLVNGVVACLDDIDVDAVVSCAGSILGNE